MLKAESESGEFWKDHGEVRVRFSLVLAPYSGERLQWMMALVTLAVMACWWARTEYSSQQFLIAAGVHTAWFQSVTSQQFERQWSRLREMEI